MNGPIYEYGEWLRARFPFRVQKIAIDAGFTCPNRDGTVGTGGCAFCRGSSFAPPYCTPAHSVRRQIEDGKAFFARKCPEAKYIAYFQSHTNTYSSSMERLRRTYEEALETDGVVGIAIATRPDCVGDEVLGYLERLARQTFVMVEYGIESANDSTLRRINRGHGFGCTRSAIECTAGRGIATCGHVIIGLPGEDAAESVGQAQAISALKLDALKIHQLQVVEGTPLAADYAAGKFATYTAEGYIATVAQYLRRLRGDMAIERVASQSPGSMLIAPRWGLKPQEIHRRLKAYMAANGYRQGELCLQPTSPKQPSVD